MCTTHECTYEPGNDAVRNTKKQAIKHFGSNKHQWPRDQRFWWSLLFTMGGTTQSTHIWAYQCCSGLPTWLTASRDSTSTSAGYATTCAGWNAKLVPNRIDERVALLPILTEHTCCWCCLPFRRLQSHLLAATVFADAATFAISIIIYRLFCLSSSHSLACNLSCKRSSPAHLCNAVSSIHKCQEA